MNAFEVVQPRPVRGGWSLRGYKGKGGGGGARQPVEAADSLHSTSYARVLDLLSEGEIAGLVNGLQSIYLNNTPLQNADGSFNFAGVTADFRAGFQTQDPIPGFPSAESPVAVGVELKAATPWVRSILNRNLSAVRVTLGVDGLSKANTENGDISGYTVNYAIDLQTDGGAWVEVLAAAFTGKTTQQYRRTHRIDLPTAVTNWTLRVRRVTPNANSNTVADTTVIESFTEVIDAKLRYPMSALVGLQVDASQFRGSVPTRAYHCRGRIIRVPSNYDPVMRSYAGIWDGTFKSAYSNNPAWVFYDLATNDRYGLGKRIPAGWINKWSLYQIGVYCDGMVSNGRGGVEPRFTCNAYLQSRGDATRVLQDLCSIFRGMVYWAAGAAVPVADMPRDPAVTYNQGDVIDGRFSYSGSRLQNRHTVALVSYNDMTDFGRQKVVYYQDDAAVARYGIRKVEISAFGCTSEAQALRVGQWAVLTAQRETRSVSFSLGLKGNLCSPGQVIEIADSAFAGRRMGGLVKSATTAKVALDAPVTAQAGDSITVMLPSGVAQSRRIAFLEMIGGTQHVSVNPAFDAAPVAESSWAISTADVATQLFTVLSVTEGTGPGLTFDVSAIQHEPGKFAAIDQGALLPERPVSVVPAQVLPTPIGVTVGAHSVTAADGTVSTTVTAAWKAVAGAAFYDVEWSRSQSDWVRMPRTALTVVDIPNAYTGDYLVRVRAISVIDTVSAWGYSAATPVAATALPPRNYDTFVVAELASGMRQYGFTYTTQRPPADLAGAEIRYILGSPVNIDWQQMRPLDDGGYYTSGFESTKPEAGLWTFALRARSRSGVLSEGMLIWRGQFLHNVADVTPDLTPPPAPTGVTAVPLMTTAQVNWASPTYTVGHGHDHSVIYAALWATGGTAPAFSAAKSVGTEQGHPASIPVELGSKYTIWVTHVSVDGVESAPSAGVTFETAQDVGKLLDVLEGKITESQLYTDLAKEIDLISGTGAGSVNARVLAEAQARAQAVAAEATTRAQALASEAAARGQDVAAMAADLQAATNDLQARIDAVNAQVSDIIGASDFDPAQAYEAGQLVKYQNKLYRAKVNTVGNLPTNTTYWDLVGDYASLGEAVAAHAAQLADHANRITQTEQGLTAEASARTTLAAQLRGNYTGSDVAQVTSGLVWSERQARVSGDSANASAIDAVKARMPTGSGKVASEASVIDEATARAAADAAAASRTTAIEARLPAGTGSLATAAAVTALDTRVTAAEGSLTSQSGQITSLQNNLAAAGGPNLVYNSSFELLASNGAIDGWALGGAGTGAVSRVASWLAAKEYAARVDAPALAAGQYKDFNPVAALYPVVDAAGNYMLSVFARAGAGVKVRIYGQSVDAAGTTLQTFTGAQLIPGEGMRITLQMGPMHANTTALRVILRVYDLSGAAVWVEWDRVQVEAGMVATAWRDNSQARDAATSSALSGLTSRVTAAEGNITSTSGQVTSLSNTLTTTTGTANAAQAAAQAASDLAGGKGKVIYSATAPAVADRQTQNLWIDITGGANTPKRWTGSAWAAVTDKVATDAAAAAAAAQATANTKADASALSALDSKVTTQGNTLTSQGSAITALQNSITNGPVLPSDFSAGLGNWTLARQGDPSTVASAAGTIVTNDADFGVCAQFNNWTVAGQNVLTKGLVQAIPGRVYRVRARFKVAAAGGFPLGLNLVAGGNTATYSSGGDAFSSPVSITAAGQIAEITALFSDKAVNAAGAIAWGATAVLLRFGLRINGNIATGLQLRVQSITVEDATADAVNADATTALTSRVTTAEGNITSTSGALTTLTNRVTAAEGVNTSQATAISGLQSSVTSINGTLTSQGSAITSLQNSLSSAGGQNLLYNPSFEVPVSGGPDGWTTTGSSGVTRTATTVTSSLDGGAARRIDATGMTTSLYASLEMATTRRVPVAGDQPMAVSAFARGTDGLRAYIVCTWMKSGAVVGSQRVSAYTPLADGWQRLSFVPPVNSGADTFYISLRVNSAGSVTAGFVEWDRAQIEAGDVVTGWRDNDKAEASAQASATQALDSRVTNAEGNISSTSSALTTLTNRVTAAEGVNTSQATAISGLNSSVTSINGTLTSQASQITNLQAGVDQAQKQAVNVIVNPSFDNGSSGWTLRAGWAVVAEGEDGKDCIKLSGASGSTSQPSTLSIAVKAGQTWRFRSRGKRSADFNGTVGNSKIRFTNQGGLLGTLTVAYSEFPVGAWGQVERTLTVTADGELSFTLVRDSTAGSVWLDDFELSNITDIQTLNAAISSEASVRATTDGYLGAQYSVRMQLSQGGQQVVGGFGISGTTSGTAGPQIDFGVMANSFWIAAPSGSPGGVSNVKPFVVQTTAQTVNGVSVPAGVYMDAAYINNVTALWARFGNLVADTIQATSISVTKLTGGNLSVGSWINSSNYV
ncbi:phage tail protein, partial [Comamonas thiooxydans]|uniref:TipJ family phage tail tip protein n=1 Tax=Comamonas thiooxydans TaxID=363952 RepID=UPI002446E75D